MWRQVVAQSPGKNAPTAEVVRYDVGWKALNTMLKSGRSLSGHERNCCFLNTRGGRFADISAAANIDFDDDGRVLALTDWDFDGDIDFWIANRTGPQVRFLRNDTDNQHGFVAFRLEGVQCNRDAIGARVELHLADGTDHPLRIRTLRAGEGYLAQSSKWLHFGLGDANRIDHVVVRWPDGSRETIGPIQPNQRYKIRQGTGRAEAWNPPQRSVTLTPSEVKVPPSTDKSRIVLIAPVPIPDMKYTGRAGGAEEPIASGSGRPRLINLWATWCMPCLQELNEWQSHRDDLQQSGLDVVAINVDEPIADRAAQLAKINQTLDSMEFPFASGYGSVELVNQFDVLQRALLARQRPLPVPSSFLIDAGGNLRIIYKGPVDVKQIVADAQLLDASPAEIVTASVPFEGIWLGQPAGSSPNQIAVKFIEGGFVKQAEQYIRKMVPMEIDNPRYKPAEMYVLLGALCLDQKRYEESADAFQKALELNPNHRQSHIELAGILRHLKQPAKAAAHYERALERRPNDPELRLELGLSLIDQGDPQAALRELVKSVDLRPTAIAHHILGTTLIQLGRVPEAMTSFNAALKLNPRLVASANNLAWLLATNETVRDGARAVTLLENLLQKREARTPGNLDTLAAAYAESGRFDEAIKTATEAVRLAKAEGDVRKSRSIQKRLSLYQQSKPYRE